MKKYSIVLFALSLGLIGCSNEAPSEKTESETKTEARVEESKETKKESTESKEKKTEKNTDEKKTEDEKKKSDKGDAKSSEDKKKDDKDDKKLKHLIDVDEKTEKAWEEFAKENSGFKDGIVGEYVADNFKIDLTTVDFIVYNDASNSMQATKFYFSIENTGDENLLYDPSSSYMIYDPGKFGRSLDDSEITTIKPGEIKPFEIELYGEMDDEYKFPIVLIFSDLRPESEKDKMGDRNDDALLLLIEFEDKKMKFTEVKDAIESHKELAKIKMPDNDRALAYANNEDLIEMDPYVKEYWDNNRAKLGTDDLILVHQFERNGITYIFTEMLMDIEGPEDDLEFTYNVIYSILNESDKTINYDTTKDMLYNSNTGADLEAYETSKAIAVANPNEVLTLIGTFITKDPLDLDGGFLFYFPAVTDVDGNVVSDEFYLKYYFEDDYVPTYEEISVEEARKILDK